MLPPDAASHSFVIRLWHEEPATGGPARWRGHITHLPGEERCYFHHLGEATDFIAGFLETTSGAPRWRRWWRRLRRCVTR